MFPKIVPLAHHQIEQGSLNGTHVGGIKQCNFMVIFVILRDFPYNNSALFGLVLSYIDSCC